mgnify:CR=1 FL=1
MKKEVKKEVKKKLRCSLYTNFNLSVFQLLKKGYPVSHINVFSRKEKDSICAILNKSKYAISYYLSSLIKGGYIRKLGYGTYEIIKDYEPLIDNEKAPNKLKSIHVDNPQPSGDEEVGIHVKPSEKPSHKSGDDLIKIRSHAFGFYLDIPKIFNWCNRNKFLDKKKIPYVVDNLGQGQKLKIDSYHIFLYNKGIRFLLQNEDKSFLTKSGTLGNELASKDLIFTIKKLESKLGLSFSINKKYKFRVTKQHQALIKNELARWYNKEGKKLSVYDETGRWLIIDDSFNLDELECVHGRTAHLDADNVVAPFFNNLKKEAEITGEVPNFTVVRESLYYQSIINENKDKQILQLESKLNDTMIEVNNQKTEVNKLKSVFDLRGGDPDANSESKEPADYIN